MIMCNVQGVTYDKHIENYHQTLQFNIIFTKLLSSFMALF